MVAVIRDGRTFYYSPCGHLIGCDDPTFDIEAEQARIRLEAFYADLETAVATGGLGYRSGSPLSIFVQDALNVVADDPSRVNVLAAAKAFGQFEGWYAED